MVRSECLNSSLVLGGAVRLLVVGVSWYCCVADAQCLVVGLGELRAFLLAQQQVSQLGLQLALVAAQEAASESVTYIDLFLKY